METPRRYRLLNLIAWLAKILAWVVLVGALVGGVTMIAQGGDAWPGIIFGGNGRAILGAIAIVGGVYCFLQMFIFGSLLSLFVDVEQNSRASADALGKLVQMGMKPAAPAAAAPAAATLPVAPPPAVVVQPAAPPPPAPKPVAQTVRSTPPPPPPALEPLPKAVADVVGEAAPTMPVPLPAEPFSEESVG